jgi:hypothetical protein
MNTAAQLRADLSTVDVSHDERIELVADGASESSQPEPIDDSWRRCLRDFRVDPESSSVPHLLTERELRISREPLHSFLLQAQEEINRLYVFPHEEAGHRPKRGFALTGHLRADPQRVCVHQGLGWCGLCFHVGCWVLL